MPTIDLLWAQLQPSGRAAIVRRVDEHHPCDLYAAVDAMGRPGLVLVTEWEPPMPPVFDTVEVSVQPHSERGWALGVWLRSEQLASLFGRLCDDLIDTTRAISPADAASCILSRLVRWRRLLEPGERAGLTPTELRGLFGELIVLQHCLHLWSADTVIASWVGPLKAPQDFTLPNLRIEVKAIRPGSSSVRISSIDQLDVSDAALLLCVVTLAAGAAEAASVSQTVEALRQRIEAEAGTALLFMFETRLSAAGYEDRPEYEHERFRVEAIRWFEVTGAFPRIRRVDLTAGVSEATYTIEIGACLPYQTTTLRA